MAHNIDITLLIELADKLERDIFALECADERLFTNGSGNLPKYKEMKSKLKEIREKLDFIQMEKE